MTLDALIALIRNAATGLARRKPQTVTGTVSKGVGG